MDNLEFRVPIFFEKKYKPEKEDGKYLGYVEGFASTIDMDKFGDIISEKAQRKSAKQLLFAGTVFFNHQYDKNPIGKVVESKYTHEKESDRKGIFVKVGISKTAPDKWMLIEEEILNAFSIGGRMKETEWVGDDKDRHRVVNGMDLYEVSIVTMPANEKATFDVFAKSFIQKVEEANRPTVIKLKDFIKKVLLKKQTNEVE